MPLPSSGRLVVVLCGPSGAGKTTAARRSGLRVYDRDDPHWRSEPAFTAALARLALNQRARAVVVRTAATSEARADLVRLVDATHIYLLTAPRDELAHRITHRDRDDTKGCLASLSKWFRIHDTDDGVQPFPGWDNLGPPNTKAHRRTPLSW